ncbi:MAG: protein kinase [Candidatus Thiodiazotropha sp.]|nr:protein kinase [Candidatus Thiodiazotropha sp.]MCU7802587.1 protein kinase [Candidatus Thiodiazotropha sp. (ex Lucinoma borealis)]MCU7840298.1 protein kinase [Candidatus Thiodiazotropha sp. (ex Troendleina suluensis)]MCM8882926.1 protein kinase [Candidatus Thiodiazotropha sp.]MCM8920636.1 protein kinase [Candidatus Thiodiazotropha sp.]
MDNQPLMPESIGRFSLIEEIGEGAMSIVYKAFDPEINRTLAIKLLRGECAADPEYRYRFLQEAKAAGKLTHPNIVTIFDVGEVTQGPYIAMEFLEGRTLEQMMDSDAKISTRETVVYGIQLAEALDYSHARGIVHRDVKPGNIISPDDGHTIRITDFGIAHVDSPNKEHRTMMGAVLGTPQYMSPEQVEGLPVDGRSDLFSLGVILYQLITGEKPFVSETLTSLLMKIVQEDPAPIDGKIKDVPQSLIKIVEKLLNKKPEYRFQTGKELATALRSVVHEIDEKQQHINDTNILPLRIKWTAIMAGVVSIAMILGSYLVYQKQVDAMIELALDSGGSLAEFIAIESAEAVLIQDWVAIETFVHEIKERQQISYLRILDHKKVLRASTSVEEVGQTLSSDAPMQLLRENEGIVISEGELNGEMVFDFQAPLVFQNKNIGKIQLGLSQTPLIAAADLTFYTMLGLLVAVVLTVAIVAYLLATGMTVPMKILRRAITHVQHGNYGYRIKKERNDELGLLFVEYNRMAEALLNEKEEAQQMDQAIPLSIEPNEDKTNQAPLQDNKQITALDEESLPPLEEDIDDATRIMQPKVGK